VSQAANLGNDEPTVGTTRQGLMRVVQNDPNSIVPSPSQPLQPWFAVQTSTLVLVVLHRRFDWPAIGSRSGTMIWRATVGAGRRDSIQAT
jgi:hypothetical protein